MCEDYVYKTADALQPSLDRLRCALESAQQEAQHAKAANLDLTGPIRAAEAEADRLRCLVEELEGIQATVAEGYPYFEIRAFENAVDACGEMATWQKLSAVPTAGTVAGHDDALTRLPKRVQEDYAQALTTHLFDEFLICHTLEPQDGPAEVPEQAVTRYLFGGRRSEYPRADSTALFLVAQW